jgi:hypothetical protein
MIDWVVFRVLMLIMCLCLIICTAGMIKALWNQNTNSTSLVDMNKKISEIHSIFSWYEITDLSINCK